MRKKIAQWSKIFLRRKSLFDKKKTEFIGKLETRRVKIAESFFRRNEDTHPVVNRDADVPYRQYFLSLISRPECGDGIRLIINSLATISTEINNKLIISE